ncbi:alpha-D-xyloside xylohydrolase [Gracilibacillus halotolerans]|uniref:Alpha-D-xyloside xylohydrolase n=1 Tax=Gracilibacillus halotolerans TaxID=74386 RepID=A0A841RLI6_9BACI|nr:alpha-xylosidase [Gracilibacillus halotolerans]MBB6513349.1 alpha-D-xyloside xylohydrolase [Gracilibacillus halotolerans]
MVKFLNNEIRIEEEFQNFENTYFLTESLENFDANEGKGQLKWHSYLRKTRFSFNQVETPFARLEKHWQFPKAYPTDPATPFEISFISPYSFRLKINTRSKDQTKDESLMIDTLEEKSPESYNWKVEDNGDVVTYTGERAVIKITRSPWSIEVVDHKGKRIIKTQTIHDSVSLKNDDPHPFSFVDKPSNKSHAVAASFTLSPNEKIFGTGESFTRLNKRGQKVVLYTRDAMGTLSQDMYKPVPFYLSSNGYGVFTHTTAPITYDFGHRMDDTQTIYSADESMDLFFFLGNPKEVLTEYTNLTGKASIPPLWSFGLWMSRISYFSEEEVRDVAKKIRDHKIPTDVIHIDTGWFEEDWRCNYKFSESRFQDATKMIKDLDDDGFKVSLWQIPYFTPQNEFYDEIIEKGLAVKKLGGGVPTEDAVLDFSNPDAVVWYQEKIADLLKQGVAAIKVDFGEGAPLEGIYASGEGGLKEHNLYPLRYNKAVAEITEEVTGDSIIWARSAWAGSQRYPIHWGGDAEITDNAMAASLRSGLSLGLSGFSFWSHDIGGFTRESPEDLYRRWLGLGTFTSHARAHGEPPKEPWEYSESFTELYRDMMTLRYQLMPYLYTQSYQSAQQGWPLLRAMFLENPEDTINWYLEDQYFFGSDMLIAPILEEEAGREVYLPKGEWYDLQTKQMYTGGKYQYIEYKEMPVIMLVRKGAVIPTIAPALSTKEMDWSQLELWVVGEEEKYEGNVKLPTQSKEDTVTVVRDNGEYNVQYSGEANVNFTVKVLK